MILRKKHGRIEISTDASDDDFGIRDHVEPTDRAGSPESCCARRETEGLLKTAIQRLPPTLRDVVQMRHMEDRSIEEVAQFLGISVSAAKSRLMRARAALRMSLVSNNW
jgi:RNA polymerase sigma-70 factor (ECF subfamily)